MTPYTHPTLLQAYFTYTAEKRKPFKTFLTNACPPSEILHVSPGREEMFAASLFLPL